MSVIDVQVSRVVVMIAPRKSGKSAFVGALRHVANCESWMLNSNLQRWRIHQPVGVGPYGVQADEALKDISRNLSGGITHGTPQTFSYVIRSKLARRNEEHQNILLIDTPGSYVFNYQLPEDQEKTSAMESIAATLASLRREPHIPSIPGGRILLDEEPEVSLVVFINDPPHTNDSGEGEVFRSDIPTSLHRFISGLHITRVLLFIACADMILPRHRNMEGVLDDFNNFMPRSRDKRNGLIPIIKYHELFWGSPHHHFTFNFLSYLESNHGEVDFEMLWGSSFGTTENGEINVKPDGVIKSVEHWRPYCVLEAFLWASGCPIFNGDASTNGGLS